MSETPQVVILDVKPHTLIMISFVSWIMTIILGGLTFVFLRILGVKFGF